MRNNMNRQDTLNQVNRIKHPPVTHTKFEYRCKEAGQGLRLDVVEMFGEPLDFVGDAPGNLSVKGSEVLSCLIGRSSVVPDQDRS